jgi:hypothetical protein
MPINNANSFSSATGFAPSDSQLRSFSAIYVGTGGDVRILIAQGTSLGPAIFRNVPSGTILPIQTVQGTIFETGTTASNLIGLN